MKTFPTLLALPAIALLLASPPLRAGPGADYWMSRLRSPAPPAVSKEPAATAPKICTDSALVAVISMKPGRPNGRGPLQPVQTGAKRVCHSCGGVTTAMKPGWPNGRGPLQPRAVAALHNCAATTCTMPAAA